jgi:predicted enzyme related to lactoylglutathione lyase
MVRAERAGATILEPAHSADWGGYLGYFTDPDGNWPGRYRDVDRRRESSR